MMTGRAQERGDDAEDHAPRPDQKDRQQPPSQQPDRQEAANYDKANGRDALNIEDVDSSNDEGAA